MAKNSRPKKLPLAFVLVFMVIWCALTLGLDVYFVRSAFYQIVTLTYSRTQGKVTKTELETRPGDEGGPTYRPIIHYSYAGNGKEYQGRQRRYDDNESSGGKTAQWILDRYHVGDPVTVHFDPRDPSRAVLQVGLEGIDLFHFMFMLPFNLVMLAFGAAAISGIARRRSPPEAGGAKVWDNLDGTHVRLYSWRPFFTGAIVAGLLAFVAVFVVMFGFGGIPSLSVMLIIWTIIVGGGTMVGWSQRSFLWDGGCELLLDGSGYGLTILARRWRPEDLVVPRKRIISLQVETIEKSHSEGSVQTLYEPVLIFKGPAGTTQRERLVQWSDEERAEALAAWLRERLRLGRATK